MNFLKGYRTVLANALMGLPLLWDVIWQLLQSPEFQAVIPAEWVPFYSLAMIAMNIFLRKLTTTPIGEKG